MRYTKILFLYQEQYSLKLLFVATENQSEGVIKLVDKNPIVSIIILIVNRQLKGSYCENGWRLKKKNTTRLNYYRSLSTRNPLSIQTHMGGK